MTIFEMLAIGFAVGLTGAMVPGPMLFATIELSLRIGWLAGPKVVFGHAILEILISILIIFGIIAVADDNMIRTISIMGGLSLCVFGILIIRGRKNAKLDTGGSLAVTGPVLAGMVTSASNPYFWIWWLSAGSSLIIEGLKTGFVAVGFFLTGHWIADVFWYTLVSGSFSRRRALMSERLYRRILAVCGMFLIAFGLWFILHQVYRLLQGNY